MKYDYTSYFAKIMIFNDSRYSKRGLDFGARLALVKRDPLLVLGTSFGGFCDWYLIFSCPKHCPGRARDLASCVCLCHDVLFLSAPFLSRSMDVQLCFQKRDGSFSASDPIAPPIEVGRWHSPQVAPAAPPAPR